MRRGVADLDGQGDVVGGLVTSFALELLVYPAIYYLWKRREVEEGDATAAVPRAA